MSIKDAEEKMRARQELGAKVLQMVGVFRKSNQRKPCFRLFRWRPTQRCDLAIWRILGWLTGGILDTTNLLEAHPQLKAHYHQIGDLEGVRSWMARYA